MIFSNKRLIIYLPFVLIMLNFKFLPVALTACGFANIIESNATIKIIAENEERGAQRRSVFKRSTAHSRRFYR